MPELASKRIARRPAVSPENRIRLNFKPQVALINRTREFVADFYDEVTGNPDLTSRLALAAHELLENVFKYSTDGVAIVDIRVVRGKNGDALRMKIRNRSEDDRIADLRRRIGQLQATDSPIALYYALLDRVVPSSEVSGLGLARICAEGEMSLAYEVNGNEVTVVAEVLLEPRNAA